MKLLFSFLFFATISMAVCYSQADRSKNNSFSSYKNFRNDPSFEEKIDFNKIDYKKIYELIFYMTNEIREKHKLPLLTYSEELEKAASLHAKDMVEKDFFDHINNFDPKKKTPNDRAKLCHIANPFLAENIIEGYGLQYKSFSTVYMRGSGKFSSTPEGNLIPPHTYLSFADVQMKGWMNSTEHRKNILSKDALQFGCGAAYFTNIEFNEMPTFYVVQNFQWYKPVTRSK